MVIDDTCNPIPSCLFILSLLPHTARMILGTRWKASPPQSVSVNIPYRINKVFPCEKKKTALPQSDQKSDMPHQKLLPLHPEAVVYNCSLS